MPRVGDLQIDEDLATQRKLWLVQRVGWGLMALVIAAAMLGLFGKGPLSDATVGRERGALRMEFERFTRYMTTSELHVLVGPDAARGGEVQVWLSRDYVRRVKIDQITPEPAAVAAQGDRYLYTFRAKTENKPISLTFFVTPKAFGVFDGEVGGPGGEVHAFRQYVYP